MLRKILIALAVAVSLCGFLPQVERLFANSWRKEAPPGTMIQTDSGSWKRK